MGEMKEEYQKKAFKGLLYIAAICFVGAVLAWVITEWFLQDIIMALL